MSVIVTMRHVRQARLCARGARAFFQRHGLDYSRFVSCGLPAEQIRATGDAQALLVADIAEREAAQ